MSRVLSDDPGQDGSDAIVGAMTSIRREHDRDAALEFGWGALLGVIGILYREHGDAEVRRMLDVALGAARAVDAERRQMMQ
jgi:hypothetical protein